MEGGAEERGFAVDEPPPPCRRRRRRRPPTNCEPGPPSTLAALGRRRRCPTFPPAGIPIVTSSSARWSGAAGKIPSASVRQCMDDPMSSNWAAQPDCIPYLEVREKQYDEKVYLDLYTDSSPKTPAV